MNNRLLFLVLVLASVSNTVWSFAPAYSQMRPRTTTTTTAIDHGTATTTSGASPLTLLLASGNNSEEKKAPRVRDAWEDEYDNRGFILWGLIIALNVWLFSIPPEFRRARFCDPCCESSCAASTRLCGEGCISFGEWKDGVTSYYANGGGIHFDFSVEEQ